MKEVPDGFEFLVTEHIKQSRPSYKVPSVVLKAFPTDSSLCVVTYLREYLKRTKPLRGSQNFSLVASNLTNRFQGKLFLDGSVLSWRVLVSILKYLNHTALELQQPRRPKQHVFLSMTYCIMLDGHPQGFLTCFTTKPVEPSNFASAILQIN